jgi:hypothetical protein
MDKMMIGGRCIRALVAVALMADGVFALMAPPALRAEMAASGFPPWTSTVIGSCALISGVLYAVPRSAMLGAILATGFLGGAICAHVRLGEFGSPPQIASLSLGAMAWTGLWLSDARVRALIPLRA